MPPKRKGHTLMGREKVFRNAVEHVRLGLGHTVLGNLNLGLAAASPSAGDGGSVVPRPAFYVELNEQLLSHSSKDFKKFRWEVLELCETVPLFQLHHRQLAQKLLARLMDRGEHRVGEADAEVGAGRPKPKQRNQRGSADSAATQAYEAFARLTIAFVHDMGSKFLPYYELFQQAIQAGMYDKTGHLIVDTSRLQLVFAVQAAWCRELRDCWTEPAQLMLVRRIIRQYVGQLHDTKEYVRRLSAELLAFLCRLCSVLLPLVVEEACGDVLQAYEASVAATSLDSSDSDAESSQDDTQRQHSSAEDEDAERGKHDNDHGIWPGRLSRSSEPASIWANHGQLLDYVRTALPHHPVVDGLTYFAAELFRGVRGALSSSFETHFVRLLYVFQLLETSGGPHAISDDSAGAVPSRSSTSVVRCLQQQHHPLSAFLDAASGEDDEDHDGGDASQRQAGGGTGAAPARRLRAAEPHTTRWSRVFNVEEAADLSIRNEGATLKSHDDIRGARYLLRSIGSLTLGNAAAAVLRETTKQTALSAADNSSSDDSPTDESENQASDSDVLGSAPGINATWLSSASGSTRASHRILTAAVLCLGASPSPASTQYIQFLVSVMSAVNCALWVDAGETVLLRRLASQLLSLLRSMLHWLAKSSPLAHKASLTVAHGASAQDALESAAAVLRLLSPLCLSPLLGSPAGGSSAAAHLLQLQQCFVPVAKAAVQVCVRLSSDDEAAMSAMQCQLHEEAAQILFAFAQDVLQKNYAFAIECERRIAEEADLRGIHGSAPDPHREDAYVSEAGEKEEEEAAAAPGGVQAQRQRGKQVHIPSFLSPFALTLLHTIGMCAWQRATRAAESLTSLTTTVASGDGMDGAMRTAAWQASVQRGALLSRLLQDHTQHTAASPLQQLLRLKSVAPASNTAVANGCGSAVAAADREMSLRGTLEEFVLSVLRHYEVAHSADQATTLSVTAASETMSYVSCILPLIQVLLTCSQESSPTYPLKTALLRVLRGIEERETTRQHSTSSGADSFASLNPAAYALYAEVAAMLVQLSESSPLPLDQAGKRPADAKKHWPRRVTDGGANEEGLRHLCRTVAVLVHGFQHLHTASAAVLHQGEEPTGVESSASSVAISDETRAQLFHGAEVLLQAISWMLSLGSKSQQYTHAQTEAVASVSGALPQHTRMALRTLSAALPDSLHAPFVQHILLECLAAPIPSLRLHALRLLRLLCHPDVDAADRLTGTPAVAPDILDALLRAARFNPLSHTGNLDGMQQDLSRLSFKVESGAITAPFERVVIARTMIGFLYVKFAGAWTVATKILCSLVAQEQTSLTVGKSAQNRDAEAGSDDDGRSLEEDEDDDEEQIPSCSEQVRGQLAGDKHCSSSATAAQPLRKRMDPVVWNTVISAYARSLILGDVVATSPSHAPSAHEPLDAGAVGIETPSAVAAASCGALLAQLPCLYELRLTEQQRHVKGELVSRAFSSTQYVTSSITLLEAAKDDFGVVRWAQHWTASQQRLWAGGGEDATTRATTSRKKKSSALAAALYATSTDRATLAQTFLAAMEAMVRSSSAMDLKARLVEDVVLELVAVERNRHPSGVDASQMRKLDQRLEVAMRACAAAPSGLLTSHQRKRLSSVVVRDSDTRNAELQVIFLSYLSEPNPRLQRVAVDNLKRLRVEPFGTYHTKLVPFCDTTKALFAFLSTFHVETDVPPHDRVTYVSAAMSLALPKLLMKVSKDKLKDQAILSRRLMGYLEHLPPHTMRDGQAKDPMAQVFDQLLHRLLSFAMPTDGGACGVATPLATAETYDFLTNVWEDLVYKGCGLTPPSREAQRCSGRASAVNAAAAQAEHRHCGFHGIRRLERLMKQLSSALRLLEAMLHAVGRRFSVYVPTCLLVALQAYLVACKQCLRRPIDALTSSLSNEDDAAANPAQARVRRWIALLSKSLASTTVSTALSHVRRAAVSIVALLLEQFPEEVMDTLRGEAGGCGNAHGLTRAGRGSECQAPFAPLVLFGKYIGALYDNSKGMTAGSESGNLASGESRDASAAKSSVTPMLRLIMAWVRSPVLLPLFPAYAEAVVGSLDEVFAVNAAAASVHRASTQAVYEGLQCVSELLSCADEVVELLPLPTAVEEARPRCTRMPAAAMAAGTFRQCFLEQYIVVVFTALYNLLTSGAAREEAETSMVATPFSGGARGAGASDDNAARHRSHGLASQPSPSSSRNRHGGKQMEGKRRPASIMSLSVSMWREVMRTISQMSLFLHTDAIASDSLSSMMSRVLELALKMIAHPVCMTDASTAQMVTGVAHTLMGQVPAIAHREHWQPLVRLFNTVPNPQARHSLCAILAAAVHKLPVPITPTAAVHVQDTERQAKCFREQLIAAARAVSCLNSFESRESFERYDFELRYHTLHSLHDFFAYFGNYGALQRGANNGSAVRRERAYEGAEDVRLPLDKAYAPALAPEAVAVLAANVMFFLRDPEQTIRALVLPLLHSMIRYASLGGQRPEASAESRSSSKRCAGRRVAPDEVAAAEEKALALHTEQSSSQLSYREQLLETVLRHEVLGSLRRGVVAKDVHIRCAHMQAFEGFARFFPVEFPSFALLYSPNVEQNFFMNVGHVQHRCRLHALALLRQHAANMHVRDILRVFVPFAMSAVKDFAEGKRNEANLTEGRARGYCDAVLLTISTIAARLPWTAYYRVLSLFLSNASVNTNLRATMLRGVVQVLSSFHFLEDNEEVADDGSNDDVDGDINDGDDAVRADLASRQREFRHARVMRVLEADVLPQLYSYIGDKESRSMAGRGVANQHSITAVRREQQREDAASAQMKNALLQLPVAIAITKIVKHFPEDRFTTHADHLLDELIKKLRTKNDKHRESARRILGAMLQETGPSKLQFVVTKLKENLVHGYQLHVLGYTVVTLLYQLYEPNSQLLRATSIRSSSVPKSGSARVAQHSDPVQVALEAAAAAAEKRQLLASAAPDAPPTHRARFEKSTDDDVAGGTTPLDEDAAVEQAEEALLRELGTATHARFGFQYGIDCLTKVLDDLLAVFLDDYLGEVGTQKEQVEVMSTMVEVKRNRALQGFAFLGKHCDAATVMEAFLQRITWVLTPPSETAVNPSELHGSARARALLVQEVKNKYLTISKGGSVDLVFVNKVRLLAVRVARSLMANPTMSVERSFEQVRRLLEQHNRTREEKVSAFEAKDGTRRIRGNAHLVLHKADRHSRKEQLDQNFLVAAVPERVDVDFSAHTVLATQQKQKLRVYRGRYGKEAKEAAKHFYREDPATAVVLDTLDEFLLKFLLSVLKQVLGIGKEKRYSKTAMKLDMLRHRREQLRQEDGEEAADSDTKGVVNEEADEVAEQLSGEVERTDGSNAEGEVEDEAEEDEEDEKDERGIAETAAVTDGDGDEDGLGTFAEAQAVAESDAVLSATPASGVARDAQKRRRSSASGGPATALLAPGSDLTVTFTREHRDLLESLVPAVLTCLQGEGSDPVVANALDCLLALVSLRPPLNTINELQKELFETVTSFVERGSVIKQRAIRLTAAMVAHQKYVVSEANAVQLVRLVRAEVMERNEYMSVSLSLLYALLGKHIHIAEVYDLVDVITELLLHWSARRVIRRRCILILTRFLLEYRLTPEKFRSHIDLYCRNLDYPELTGRTALLELLDALVVRLPAVVLREEAPVLLVPLAATVCGSEWVECRKQGGVVLQHLARYAGVDVLVPVLSDWLTPTQPRATRSMAVQAWATILPALSEFYELDHEQPVAGEDDDTLVTKKGNRTAFQACCAWSVKAVLDGCLFDQLAAARRNKRLDQLSAKEKEKVELDGWAYIFYSLRAAEAMLTALPDELYPLLAPRLLPRITDVLLQHAHPWVRAVAVRILRHYLYTFVESRCHYLQEDVWQELASSTGVASHDASPGAAAENKKLQFLFEPSGASAKALLADALQHLQAFAALLRRLLSLVSTSDVAMEAYNAHRAIADPARGELLKVAVYALRAMSQVAIVALTRTSAVAATASSSAPVQAASRLRAHREMQQRVGVVYTSLQHQLHSLIAPVVLQDSVVNYMVRSATLLQLLGGWVSVLPHEMADTGAEDEALPPNTAFNAQVRWLAQQLLCPTTMLQQSVLPLLSLGLRAKPISEKLSLIAYQVTSVVEQQLEERRHELTAVVSTQAFATAAAGAVGTKRKRDDEGGAVGTAAELSSGIPLDEVLVALKTQLASIREARRDQQVIQNTKKALKRNRRQMEMEEKKQAAQRRPVSRATRQAPLPNRLAASSSKQRRRGA